MPKKGWRKSLRKKLCKKHRKNQISHNYYTWNRNSMLWFAVKVSLRTFVRLNLCCMLFITFISIVFSICSTLTVFNPIQDGLFRGYSRMGVSYKLYFTYKRSKKYVNHVTHPLSSADISNFSPKISTFCYIKNTCIDCILIDNFQFF